MLNESQEKKLRNFIRQYIVKEDQELLLREFIQKILNEAKVSDPGKSPYKVTAINVLEGLLRNIVPTLEEDYKVLTSSPEQRESFAAHIINAAKNSLQPSKMNAAAVSMDANQQQGALEEVDVSVEPQSERDAFIDIEDQDDKEIEAKVKDEFSLEGYDKTGRNMALQTFKKIEQQILDAFKLLSGQQERNIFLKYLLINLKLYFERFEDEVKSKLTSTDTAVQ